MGRVVRGARRLCWMLMLGAWKLSLLASGKFLSLGHPGYPSCPLFTQSVQRHLVAQRVLRVGWLHESNASPGDPCFSSLLPVPSATLPPPLPPPVSSLSLPPLFPHLFCSLASSSTLFFPHSSSCISFPFFFLSVPSSSPLFLLLSR